MKSFLLDRDHSYQLILSADARHTPIDYINDQVWELSLAAGEPSAVTLFTTYGFRCHWMRIFPRFIQKEIIRINPQTFTRPPRLEKAHTNWIVLSFEPFEGISVTAEYRAIDSHRIAGRFQVTNYSILPQSMRLEWVNLLNPLGSGESMLALQKGERAYLQGRTGELTPVCVMSGNSTASPGPYPSLIQNLELYPGSQSTLTWALASLDQADSSFDQAVAVLNQPWEAETARVEMMSRSQEAEIDTGNPEWDAVLSFSQKTAWSFLIDGKPALPHHTLVLSRQPDLGYSRRGDGLDYNYLRNGQTALDVWYLSQVLLPGAPVYLKELLENFLAVQKEDGWIDWKPGPAGQTSNQLCLPILASIALDLHPYLNDLNWLKNTYTQLASFAKAWLDPIHDRDSDHFPEWQHPLQTGLEESPMYDRWSPAAQGLEISMLESPSLAAFLAHELDSLMEISKLTGQPHEIVWLQQAKEALVNALNQSWNEERCIYNYRDAITHHQTPPELLGEWFSSGDHSLAFKFDQPRRFVLHLISQDESTLVTHISLRGYDGREEVEEDILPHHFAWSHGHANLSTQGLFESISAIKIHGLREGDSLKLYLAGYDFIDCSLFLPLWAGILSEEKAKRLIDETLLGGFRQALGIPICPRQKSAADPLSLDCLSLPWNLLIAEGLVRYGYHQQAAELVSGWIQAVDTNLKDNHTFQQYYHAGTGAPFGERNHLHGIIPVKFFLKLAGIQMLSPDQILFQGINLFPHPIHVQYRKLMIHCESHEFVVEYPEGPKLALRAPGPHRVVVN